MNNPRITLKERNLLKGAIRRVFSRSELRNRVINSSIIEHKDPNRPRVSKWVKCAVCGKPEAKYKAAADHIVPVIPVDKSFEEMSVDEVIDRLWCEESNLQTICESCHDEKTRQERKQRLEFKRAKKGIKTNERKTNKASKKRDSSTSKRVVASNSSTRTLQRTTRRNEKNPKSCSRKSRRLG